MLRTCGLCTGFLPPSRSSCPHCGADAPTRRIGAPAGGLVRGVLAAATGGVTALTLMACYGLPPCDGGACSGAGGTGGTGGSSTTTGTTGTGGAGGAGGGGSCAPCGEVQAKLGTDAATICAPTKAAFEALVACACTSMCAADCATNTCAGKEITGACQTCIDTSCSGEKAACTAK